MGNSEVGHLNIGAGRIVYQDIMRIERAVADGSIAKIPALVGAFEHAKSKGSKVHFLGLLSDGGVHSHINHLLALLDAARANGVDGDKVCVQAFLDGRDTPPKSSPKYVKTLLDHLKKHKFGRLGTMSGRYYGMDRDKRWERIELAYNGLVDGTGKDASADPIASIEAEHKENVTDEFIKPLIVDKGALIEDGDALVFFDFRADRMRQITATFGLGVQFQAKTVRKDLHVVTMNEYNAEFPFPMLFGKEFHKNVLAEWLGAKGVSQHHVAETEKYAHVTFFFNGGVEKSFPGEERAMVPSPKVATYDLAPSMNMDGIAEVLEKSMAEGKHPFVMCNLAPPDMVGHTGVYEAAVKACSACDAAIARIAAAANKHGYTTMVTSDHGNAEVMKTPEGNPVTSHTTNFVPFIIDSKDVTMKKSEGILADVAPTVLAYMGLDSPSEMTGQSLI